MTINVRTKGAEGERQVCKILNPIVGQVRKELGLSQLATIDELFQRNQNQSAVGGSDLTNPMGLDIEVKRQEALSINTWWKQTLEAAARSKGMPILIYKQNHKPWKIMMLADLPMQSTHVSSYVCLSSQRVEIDLLTFNSWFKVYATAWVKVNV